MLNHTKLGAFLFDDLSTIHRIRNLTFLHLTVTDLRREACAAFWCYYQILLQIPEAAVVKIILNIRVEWAKQ